MQRWQIFARHRFVRLLRHCIDRIFYGGASASDTPNGDLDLGIGIVLALLAVPGAFTSVLLSEKYGSLFLWLRGVTAFDPYAASLADEYFFIALSMAVAGSVAVWKWDSLLPDRRDYANLAPLSLPRRYFFFSNLTALLLLSTIVSLDINALSSVLFPLLVCSSYGSFGFLAVFFATHLLSVALGGMFGFLGVLGVLAALMALLPYRTFRKVSVLVRSAMLFLFIALVATSFSVPVRIDRLGPAAHSWNRLPPSAWFLGLCQSLRGRSNPLLAALDHAAIVGSAAVLVLTVAAYALSYRRCFVCSAETATSLPDRRHTGTSFFFRAVDKTALRSPFGRTAYRFVLWTLFRSEIHTLAFGCSTALGVILVAQTLLARSVRESHSLASFPSAELLQVPITLSYFLVLGLRFAFEIPASSRANWLFRFGVDPAAAGCASLAKKVIFTFEIPLLAACFGVYDWYWGWQIALLHIALVAAVSLLLVETVLLEFRKIPFTCPVPPFRINAIVSALIYLFGFLAFSTFTANLESTAFEYPFPFAYFIPILLAMWWLGLYLWRKYFGNFDRQITFEEIPRSGVELLDLTFRH
jgi:hypothetical protein